MKLRTTEYFVREVVVSMRRNRWMTFASIGTVAVDYGSIVVTDKQRLFISVGMGKFVSGNETYFGISANVPVFQVMKGKKKGESFVFNGVKQTIVDVF